jgi:hypothetical protein
VHLALQPLLLELEPVALRPDFLEAAAGGLDGVVLGVETLSRDDVNEPHRAHQRRDHHNA